MALVVQTEPAAEPVTAAECKTHSRISTSADDTLIGLYITTARQQVERFLCRTLINTTYDLYMDGFTDRQYVDDCGAVHLPMPPVSSVTSVTYTDDTGTSQVWSTAQYAYDLKSSPARLYPAYGYTYPTTRDIPNSVVIRYVAGYGAAGSNVPEAIKTAIKQVVGTLYDTGRESHAVESVINVTPTQIPYAGELLLWPYRIVPV